MRLELDLRLRQGASMRVGVNIAHPSHPLPPSHCCQLACHLSGLLVATPILCLPPPAVVALTFEMFSLSTFYFLFGFFLGGGGTIFYINFYTRAFRAFLISKIIIHTYRFIIYVFISWARAEIKDCLAEDSWVKMLQPQAKINWNFHGYPVGLRT